MLSVEHLAVHGQDERVVIAVKATAQEVGLFGQPNVPQKRASGKLAGSVTGSRLVFSYGPCGGPLLHGTNLNDAGQLSASGRS
jgi:hypothetical protein